MKTTPRNISAHPDGYLVRIVRGDLKWTAFVPSSRPDALGEAVRLRDRFYKICGPVGTRKASKIPRSNTEVVGISETIHWKGVRPRRNFIVHTCGKNKRFYYGQQRTRTQAFNAAVAHRAQALSVKPETLFLQWL